MHLHFDLFSIIVLFLVLLIVLIAIVTLLSHMWPLILVILGLWAVKHYDIKKRTHQ